MRQQRRRRLTARSEALRCAIAILLALLTVQSAAAQGVPLDQRADVIRAGVAHIGLKGKITVEMPDGRRYRGKIVAIDTASFTLDEISVRQKEKFSYTDIYRVQSGYVRGQRGPMPHAAKLAISTSAFVGVLLIITVVIAKD